MAALQAMGCLRAATALARGRLPAVLLLLWGALRCCAAAPGNTTLLPDYGALRAARAATGAPALTPEGAPQRQAWPPPYRLPAWRWRLFALGEGRGELVFCLWQRRHQQTRGEL